LGLTIYRAAHNAIGLSFLAKLQVSFHHEAEIELFNFIARKATLNCGNPLPRSRRSSLSTKCPKPTVKKPGSGRSPGTLENEKLPFAMRLRYYSLNGPYAASTDVDDDNCVALEGPVSGVNLTLEWIELDPDCMAGDH
jgi:hypothetical protein